MAATLAAVALGWLSASPSASAARKPGGALLQHIAARGEIVIGVRAYRRPSPDPEARPEPDEYDLALARHLSRQLGARLRTVELAADDSGDIHVPRAGADPTPGPPLDLALGLAAADAPIVRSQAADGLRPGGVVILPRPGQENQPAALALAGTTLCAAAGSPYAATLEQTYGARIKTLPSAIAAISAFSAFECAAVVADSALLNRLQSAPDWTYYRRLPLEIKPAFADQATLAATADARDQQALQAVLTAWTRSPEGRAQREQRLSLQAFEATLLQPGSYCH